MKFCCFSCVLSITARGCEISISCAAAACIHPASLRLCFVRQSYFLKPFLCLPLASKSNKNGATFLLVTYLASCGSNPGWLSLLPPMPSTCLFYFLFVCVCTCVRGHVCVLYVYVCMYMSMVSMRCLLRSPPHVLSQSLSLCLELASSTTLPGQQASGILLFLPPAPRLQNVPSITLAVYVGAEALNSCLYSKHFISWAISLAHTCFFLLR